MINWSEHYAEMQAVHIPAGTEVLLDMQPAATTRLQLDGVLRVRTGYTLGDIELSGLGVIRPESLPDWTPDEPPPAVPVISRLAFMERFTNLELAAILGAAKTSALVEVWVKKLELASEVDLNYAGTRDGVAALAEAGLIAAHRVAEILA